jgi:rhodanese-related sulfurtransferase
MSLKRSNAWFRMIFIICLAVADVGTSGVGAFTSGQTVQPSSTAIQFVTAEELKAKVARNEQVAIIDVRGSSGLLENDNKIKGAIYVKLRRLKSRLGLSPLKDVPRDQEVVTYCACPNDESSIRAAQMLLESGFKRVRVLKGGWVTWKKSNGPVEPMSRVM